jgi:hypothetical protein
MAQQITDFDLTFPFHLLPCPSSNRPRLECQDEAERDLVLLNRLLRLLVLRLAER